MTLGTRGCWRVAACWLACFFGVACESPDPTPLGRGRRIFARSCAGCHGQDGRGVHRLGLVKPPRDLTNAAFHARVSDDELRRSIRLGKGQMPAFGGLMSDADINDVITFIRSLPPKPPTQSGGPSASLPAPRTEPNGAARPEGAPR